MIIGGVGLVVIIGLLFLLTRALSGGSAEEQTASGGGFTPPSPSGAGFPGGPPQPPSQIPGGPPTPGGASLPGGPPMPGALPGPPTANSGQPASGGLSGAAPTTDALGGPLQGNLSAAPAATAKPGAKLKPLYKPRPDPFAPPGVDKLDKKKLLALQRRLMSQLREQALRSQMASVPIPNIYRAKTVAPVNPETQQPTETPVVRRTAGLLYGDRVLAVLETDGRTSVVKLGDVLTSGADSVRVTKIDRNGITLRKLGKGGGIIVVPLKSAPEGGSVGAPGGTMPMPGGPMYRRSGGPPMPGGPPLPS